MRKDFKMDKKRIALWIVGCIVFGALMLGLYILVTQALWNWLVPLIFKGPVITYWQTGGLLLLVCMFTWLGCGGGRGHHKGGRHHRRAAWKQKWENKWCRPDEETGADMHA